MTVEALPAGYGDSVLVTCALGRGVWRLLVDTGPDECWSTLQQRLAQIPVDRDGRRYIDLAVISHIDHDHIGAARALFDDRSLGLTFGDIWFNAPPRPASRGVAAGQSLAALLGAEHTDLPWNKAWGGQAAVTAAEAPFIELPSAKGKPRLTLLSPTPATLANLFKVWEKELRKLGQSEAPEPARPVSRGALDLEELAAKATAKDHAITQLSGSPGDYTLRLAVTDNAGTRDSYDFTLAVSAGDGGGSSGGGRAIGWPYLSLLAGLLVLVRRRLSR